MRVRRGPLGDINVVRTLEITCKDLGSDYNCKVVATNRSSTITGGKTLRCEGWIGSGIYGKSGTMIDKIGLSCTPS